MKQLDEKTIIIGPVRLSYLQVFTPKADKKGVLKYSAQLLLPKASNEFNGAAEAEIKAYQEFLMELIKSYYPKFKLKDGKPVLPTGFKIPLRNGDSETKSDGEPRVPGHWFFNASQTVKEEFPISLLDGNRKPVTSGWKSGDWGLVKVGFFAFEAEGNYGIGAGLRGIQFTKHDESLGGSYDGAEGFEDVPDADKSEGGKSSTPISDGDYNPFEDQ